GQSKATKVKAFHPKQEWIDHLSEQAKASDVPVFFKTNLGLDDHLRIREYPTSAMALLLEPDTGSTTRTNDLVNQIEILPVVEAEPESDIVVEYAGKRIYTLNDLYKVKTPDQKLLGQLFDLHIAVIKASKLVNTFRKHPISKMISIWYDSEHNHRKSLGFHATMSKEVAEFYREMTLIDGGRSESEAQIIDPTEADQEGQLLMDGLLEKRVVQDGEAESR
ncbi:MAG: hypothetical protein QGI86_26225, partial [Candidatus Poribacteria bacterium]|nr:hypothetical protein [Candidatus Poribacteria bacterium]